MTSNHIRERVQHFACVVPDIEDVATVLFDRQRWLVGRARLQVICAHKARIESFFTVTLSGRRMNREEGREHRQQDDAHTTCADHDAFPQAETWQPRRSQTFIVIPAQSFNSLKRYTRAVGASVSQPAPPR